ncbi:ABC transporter substrate-binding protein [Aristaeella lactis]|uniref:Peptide/nickel transport system substrate-binding protein n=1 Tax=Aristaeella lactis TaxID=3046383 RepID=A0AC61PN18_9FIRM|nr:ABC transporter substrate-binding protein [Aristaeella lactis]QUA52786.1 ABC transporter substrate-binding protein [Aristaeella lactis]SMC73421.1 peptide/nickel transport system substrate-binding protein [Aristaeella lactis]
MKKLFALLLAACMLMSVTAVFAEEAASADIPLVVATSTLSQKFSPYFADTAYDQDVVSMTQISMMTTDRVGGIIYNGIEGETIPYNGTDYTYYGTGDLTVNYDEATDITTYGYKMRNDLKFSDGEPVTIDDVIFTYYVYLDPAYNGSTTLSSYDIVGLQAYRTQIPEANLESVTKIANDIKAAGFGYELKEGDSFTQEEYDAYYNAATELWKNDTQGIVDYVMAKYAADYAEAQIGYTVDEVNADEGLKVALGMVMWGFGKVEEADGKKVFTTSDGKAFNLTDGERPVIDDYFNATYAAYEGNIDNYLGTESAVGATTDEIFASTMTMVAKDQGVDMDAGVPNIAGIKRVDDYTVEVQVKGFSAPAVYSILGLNITPMHYYGDPAQYDYENNKFGHPFGDLSIAQSKTDAPMGAGPYKFVKYDNRVVYYEANEYYYKGAPKTKTMQFKETNAAEVASAVQTGTADGGEMTGSKTNFELLKSFNSNNEVTGDVVTTYSVANLGYGYIGINADTVNVAGEPGSEASKNLRKGLATILAVYRDTAFDSYYGDAAAVINYPISSTSWAAPQATDEGYRVAYSVDAEGNDIYTAEMSAEDKYEAAKKAAIGFFKAAGYTFDEAAGKFTEAPEGASLSYEVIIPGDGTGDHPSFAVLTDAREALGSFGIELKINDPADSNVLWDALDAGTQNLWCAAWGSTIDPDMYQVYHSSNIVGKGGSDSNHYHIQSEKLDEMILNARQSSDQAYRKEVYKDALNEIMDWAVEIPAYQRQNIVIASSQRVNIDTVTPDVTTYWGWLSEIETLEMNATK